MLFLNEALRWMDDMLHFVFVHFFPWKLTLKFLGLCVCFKLVFLLMYAVKAEQRSSSIKEQIFFPLLHAHNS